MKKKLVFICIVILRSPVAEYLVKHFHSDKYDASSYGINPILKTHMDPRSIKFLDEKNIKTEIHSPKKISSKVMEDAYKVFAMDEDILFQLNKNFTSRRPKLHYSLQFQRLIKVLLTHIE